MERSVCVTSNFLLIFLVNCLFSDSLKDGLLRDNKLCGFSPSPPEEISVCILHLGLRITEKLLRLEADAEYSAPGISLSVKIARIEKLEARIQRIVSHIRIHPPGYKAGQNTTPSKRSKVVGLVGNDIHKLSVSASMFMKPLSDASTSKETTHFKKARELWSTWASIWEFLRKHHLNADRAHDALEKLVQKFSKVYLSMYDPIEVTPYIHILVCHLPDHVRRYPDLAIRCQQGMERKQGDQKLTIKRAVALGPGLTLDPAFTPNMQLMRHDYRRIVMAKNPDALQEAEEASDLEEEFNSSFGVEEDDEADSDSESDSLD